MGYEIIEMIKSPFHVLLGKQTIYFQTQTLSCSQIEKHQQLSSNIANALI